MVPASYRITWADNSSAVVTIQPGRDRKPKISIAGLGREHLLSIFDYGTTAAIAAELAHIAQARRATVESLPAPH